MHEALQRSPKKIRARYRTNSRTRDPLEADDPGIRVGRQYHEDRCSEGG